MSQQWVAKVGKSIVGVLRIISFTDGVEIGQRESKMKAK